MNIQEKLKNWIKETLKITEDFVLVHPKDLKNGDYSFFGGKDANDYAEALRQASDFAKATPDKQGDLHSQIEKIEVVGPFVNFYLSKKFFAETVKEIKEKGANFAKNLSQQRKIIVEYTDPNPFKELHIGHLMSNAIGESISRIIEANGADLKRISYGGDVGLHVAKAIFAVLADKEQLEQAKKMNEQDQIKFWAKAYVWGNNQYENSQKNKGKIDALNKIIFEKSDSEINKLYDWGREISIKYFLEMFKKLDTHFDKNIWESEVTDDALKAVALGLKQRILEESEGAIIFRGENYGLHTRVFINSNGVPVYEAKELGLGIKKYQDFSFDQSIVITGNEQNEYFKVVLKATELIKPEVTGKTVHIGHGMLRFASGKMSSRLGNVITAEDLIRQVEEKIGEKLVGRDYSGELKKQIAEIVAIGAIKYSILRQAIGGDIIFDFDKSISFEGDSGPYLQYTAVRANSVLEKAKVSKMPFDMSRSVLDTWQTTELEKYLYRFPEIVERAGKEYAPHYIVTYLTELASIFNSFYAKEKIIDPSILGQAGENDPASPYKIALTAATAAVLKSGLNLLGIKVPDRM